MQKKNNADELHDNTLFEALSATCRGLIYTSETDAAVEAFQMPTGGRSARDILGQSYASDDGPSLVKEQEPGSFFMNATRRSEWHDESRNKRAEMFQELRDLLEKNLRSVAVYRIGEIDVEIFVAGLDDQGNLIGIKTRAVET